jgi:uncharacterized PurR-regulated membrane protein YhhQ (DUF165 family)
MNDQEQSVNLNMQKQEEQHKKNMQSVIKPVELKTFKLYPFIIAVMATLQVLCIMYGRKFFLFFGLDVAVGGLLIMPVILFIFQIVSECYGWQYARQIVWANFIVNLIVTAVTFGCRYIPFSPFNHSGLQNAYIALMDTMWVSAIVNGMFVFLSDYAVSTLMSWTRFHFKGRFMFIRMILLHIFSESILLIGVFISLSYNGYETAEIIKFITSTFIARAMVSIALLPFVGLTIWYIQERIEQVVAFDTGRDSWNIFHWNIDNKNTVQFDAKEWSRLSAEKKKRVDISKIALDYYTDDKLGIDKIFKNRPKDK